MRFLKHILIALLLVLSSRAFAQVNLVLNPGFESYSQCPTMNDGINLARYWSSIDSSRSINGYCIPDYCNACDTNKDSIVGIPASRQYWQYAHGGNGMAQVIMFNNEFTPTDIKRDYLQGRLSRKLTIGKSYCVSFYVCLTEAGGYGIREISAYLDNGSIDTVRNCDEPQTRYTPQVTNSSGVITDTMRWTKIEGSFIANGTEQFITIGNFKDKTHTTYVPVPRVLPYSAAFSPDRVLYLVDDVSVVESTTKAYAGPDTHVGKGDSVFIGRPDGAMDCSWTALGSSTVIGTGAGIWVKPAVTTNYVVTQTLCGAVTKDTVKVDVWKAGVTSVNGQTQLYSLAPNPNKGNFEIIQSVANDEQVNVEIYDVTGRKIYQSQHQQFRQGKASIDAALSLREGLYFLMLTDGKGNISTLRFLKQ